MARWSNTARWPRATEISMAVGALVRAGEKPTSRKVLAWIADDGRRASDFPNGMSGRDLRFFAESMRNVGFMRVRSAGGRPRWERFA